MREEGARARARARARPTSLFPSRCRVPHSLRARGVNARARLVLARPRTSRARAPQMEAAKARAASLPVSRPARRSTRSCSRAPTRTTSRSRRATWSGAGSKWASSLEGFGDAAEARADGAAAEADGHDAWASHLSELIAEADAAPFADGTRPTEVFGAVKPYIDEALKDEHADRAPPRGDQRRGADAREITVRRRVALRRGRLARAYPRGAP